MFAINVLIHTVIVLYPLIKQDLLFLMLIMSLITSFILNEFSSLHVQDEQVLTLYQYNIFQTGLA